MIKALTTETVREFRDEIAQFYFDNLRKCSCLNHYTYDEAYEKIGALIEHLENGTCIAYGAFEGNEIIGYIWAYPHSFREENRIYVNEISIKEEYRGKRYGKQLLEAVEEKAAEMDIYVLYLHAEANNQRALDFYKSSGYVEERIQFRKEIEKAKDNVQ